MANSCQKPALGDFDAVSDLLGSKQLILQAHDISHLANKKSDHAIRLFVFQGFKGNMDKALHVR